MERLELADAAVAEQEALIAADQRRGRRAERRGQARRRRGDGGVRRRNPRSRGGRRGRARRSARALRPDRRAQRGRRVPPRRTCEGCRMVLAGTDLQVLRQAPRPGRHVPGVRLHPRARGGIRAVTHRLVVEADGGPGQSGIAAGGAVVIDAQTGGCSARSASMWAWRATTSPSTAADRGTRAAFERDAAASVLVRMDSKLVVEQMSGAGRSSIPTCRCSPAGAGADRGRDVAFQWVPRLENAADAAANESMDRGESFRRDLDGGRTERRPGSSSAGRRRVEPHARRRGRADGVDRGIGFASGWPRPRPSRRDGCGATRPRGTPRCSPPACASRAATTCGCATRSCGISALVTDAAALRAAASVGCRTPRRRDGGRRPRSSTGTTDRVARRAARPMARRARWPSSRGSARRSRHPPIRAGCACSSPPSPRARSSPRSCAPRGCRGMPPRTIAILVETLGERPPGGGPPAKLAGGGGARARGARRPGGEPRLAAEAAARAAPRRRAGRVDEPLGARRAASIRSSSRCSSTRSSRGC